MLSLGRIHRLTSHPKRLTSCHSLTLPIRTYSATKNSLVDNKVLPLSLYVHWPYCSQICPYCDFNKYLDPRKNQLHNKSEYQNHEIRLKKGLIRDLQHFAELLNGSSKYRLGSIYFGGGTPSLALPETFHEIIQETKKLKLLDDEKYIEITLEANPPDCFDREKMRDFSQIGINRISLGVQSLHDEDLQFLGRNHNGKEARMAIEACLNTFPRVTFDLIFGRHLQKLDDWKAELNEALGFGAGHISLYSLTIEPKTRYHKMHENKSLVLPDRDTRDEMYFAAQEICEKKGFHQYEVSNYSKPGQESRHNLHYWNYLDSVGIGPSASGRLKLLTENGMRKFELKQVLNPTKWVSQVETKGNGIMDKKELTRSEYLHEFILCGMRKRSGIDRESFELETGYSIEEFFNLDWIKNIFRNISNCGRERNQSYCR